MKTYKTDCFAFGGKSGCRALVECNCENCSTYKTWDECYRQQIRCADRLMKVSGLKYQFNIPKNIINQMVVKYSGNTEIKKT